MSSYEKILEHGHSSRFCNHALPPDARKISDHQNGMNYQLQSFALYLQPRTTHEDSNITAATLSNRSVSMYSTEFTRRNIR